MKKSIIKNILEILAISSMAVMIVSFITIYAFNFCITDESQVKYLLDSTTGNVTVLELPKGIKEADVTFKVNVSVDDMDSVIKGAVFNQKVKVNDKINLYQVLSINDKYAIKETNMEIVKMTGNDIPNEASLTITIIFIVAIVNITVYFIYLIFFYNEKTR
ncbi:unknown [Clostridium sp. CAG:1219]|nr:unknown [Clostridium sp. CAG:1219]